MCELNNLFKQCVIKMYGDCCVLCGAHATSVHHIHPKGMGGANLNTSFNPLNGVPLCHGCHSDIHDVIGERHGMILICDKLPILKKINHLTMPFEGTTKSEIKKELVELNRD